jgi:hypothetical protein
MHMLHEHKNAHSVVTHRLPKSLPRRNFTLLIDRISSNSFTCKHTLVWCEPSRDGWVIGQEMRAADRDDEGGDALQDKQPAPASETCYAVHFEDTDCDEAGKGGREDVAGVENCDAGCYFATCIEDGEEVERASVMRC